MKSFAKRYMNMKIGFGWLLMTVCLIFGTQNLRAQAIQIEDEHIRIMTKDVNRNLLSLSNELLLTYPLGHLTKANIFFSSAVLIHDFSKSPLPIKGEKAYDVNIIDKDGAIIKQLNLYSEFLRITK